MITYYFWKNNEVITLKRDGSTSYGKLVLSFNNCYCVDTSHEGIGRFGMYVITYGWKPIAIEDFPPEFRASLLLLGIK